METLARLQQHLIPVVVDLLRLCVWLAVLTLVFIPLERIFALSRQKVFRKSFFQDLAWYFLGGLLPSRLLIPSMAAIGWALHSLVPGWLLARVAGSSLSMRFAASMIVGEIGFYWGHRWSHQIPFLWRFHAVHHSAEEMDWLVNTRAHPVDLVFTRLCGFVPMYVLGLSQPLLGGGLDVVPLLVILTSTVWGFFIHANLSWRFGPLEWLVATPAFHHWHHTYEEPLNRNFSPMLPLVDRLFGTYYAPNQWPSRYGTASPVAPGLGGQLLLMPPPPPHREAATEIETVR